MSNAPSSSMFAPPPPAPETPPAGAVHVPTVPAGAAPPGPPPTRGTPPSSPFVFADAPSAGAATWRADFAVVLRVDHAQRPTVEIQVPVTSTPANPALQRMQSKIADALRAWLGEIVAGA